MLLSIFRRNADVSLIFLSSGCLYIGLAWLVSGGERWWVLDHIAGFNIFYGDDAYRFFLARSAWLNLDLYAYNFMLPVNLVLEGVAVSLAQGNLFISRSIHGLLAATSLCLLWLSGRDLGISRLAMAAAIIVMGLMPFYALVSLSFYGEIWLSLLLNLALLLFLRKSWLVLACIAGLLPLIRPEGLFYMVPFWLYMLHKKQWRACILMLLPGGAYGAFLLLWLENPLDIGLWRLELRDILSKVPLSEEPWAELRAAYSPLFLLPAAFGWLFTPLRVIWPWLAGAMLWCGYLLFSILTGLSDYEPRYTYSLIPALVFSWAAFWSWAMARLSSVNSKAARVVAFAFSITVLAAHFNTMAPIKRLVDNEGVVKLMHIVASGQLSKIFGYHSSEVIDGWRTSGQTIEQILLDDTGIDRLIMFDAPLYYHVDPQRIPANVVVGFPAMGYLVFHILLDGQVFAQHAGGRMYSYFRFGVPDFSQFERRALYADLMPMPDYPYLWQEGDIRLYLLSYRDGWQPEVDLDDAELVTEEDLVKEFRRWRY